jgi:hypothetical protein
MKILVLYDPFSTMISTVREYLNAFRLYSRHDIFYSCATTNANTRCEWNLDIFDVIVIHYSVRLAYPWHISPSFASKLSEYRGLKILFIQDEYDHTEQTRRSIERLGIKVVFTCVPVDEVYKVYPRERFPHVELISILTGYVPSNSQRIQQFATPLSERRILIGYRGRPLAFRYGNLAQEKWQIGAEIKRYCEEYSIAADIAWTEEARIYGDNWYRFLGSCVASLGTESGSNIFDETGKIQEAITAELRQNPSTPYEIIWEKYLADHEGIVKMNQISPRVFEAIALRTALILFEGNYSGIVKPDIHFIPLKKDYSNVAEVFEKIRSTDYVAGITERAYRDIIESGAYTYANLISKFDESVERMRTSLNNSEILLAAIGVNSSGAAATEDESKNARESVSAISGVDMMYNIYLRGVPTTSVLEPPNTKELEEFSNNKSSRRFGENEVLPLRFQSNLMFYRDHGIEIAGQSNISNGYVAAAEGQNMPQSFDIRFNPCELVKLYIVWESMENYAADFFIEVSLKGKEVNRHRIEVKDNESQISEIKIPSLISDFLRVTVSRFAGQQRLLLRQVKVYGSSPPETLQKQLSLLSQRLHYLYQLPWQQKFIVVAGAMKRMFWDKFIRAFSK